MVDYWFTTVLCLVQPKPFELVLCLPATTTLKLSNNKDAACAFLVAALVVDRIELWIDDVEVLCTRIRDSSSVL